MPRSVEDVFDAERHPAEQGPLPGLIERPRLRPRCLAGEKRPRPYHRLALGDPFETARHHRLRGQPPALDQAEDIGRKQAVRFDIRHSAQSPQASGGTLSFYLATAPSNPHTRTFFDLLHGGGASAPAPGRLNR